jgi:hypothetical protein
MNKENIEVVAGILRHESLNPKWGPTTWAAMELMRVNIITSFADCFEKQDPNFSRTWFIRACEVLQGE